MNAYVFKLKQKWEPSRYRVYAETYSEAKQQFEIYLLNNKIFEESIFIGAYEVENINRKGIVYVP